MKALRFHDGRLAVENVPPPGGGNEAVVRVLLSGICNTDLEIVRGYAGFSGTIGHEFVGVVESAADRPEIVGKRVVGEINAGCGVCDVCQKGDPRHCPARTVLGIVGRDGAHAQFLNLPSRNLIEVPESVNDEEAVFAEPLAAALGITEQVEFGRDTGVAVIGDGKLGLLCALALKPLVGRLVVVGRHREKLSVAESQGIAGVVEGDRALANERFDVVVEASGSESGFNAAVGLVRPRGKIVLKSTFHGTPAWPASSIVVNEITVVGSRCGRFRPALELLAEGKIKVDGLISDTMALSEGVSAVKRASEKNVLKVLLRADQ